MLEMKALPCRAFLFPIFYIFEATTEESHSGMTVSCGFPWKTINLAGADTRDHNISVIYENENNLRPEQ